MGDKQGMERPTKGIWKRFLILIPLMIVLGVISFFYIRPRADRYTAFGRLILSDEELQAGEVTFSNPGVVEVESVSRSDMGLVLVRFHALADGRTEATFTTGDSSTLWMLEVRDGALIEGGVNFEGWESLHVSACIGLAVTTALFASVFLRLLRASWFGYTMVASGGGFIFTLFQLLLNLGFLLFWHEPDFYFFVSDLTRMASYFAVLTLVPMSLLAVLVSLSNIALIRHEGRRPINLLGVATSVVWAAFVGVWMLLGSILYQNGISYQLSVYLDTIMAVAIAFGECLLLSTMVCAWLASRHVPRHGMDYLVMLGCGIRADGTPCPLLAGRVDRAVTFDAQRVAMGDAPAVFVPSGGQGPDEPVSEAQSMGTYLQERHGIPRERIVLEDRSTTTRENMAFSREVIERHADRGVNELRVGFSTTNYHVFRGYVCAHQAGMVVEGLGSKTKYYFWPNAFLREFAGLLVGKWESILIIYAGLTSIYLFADYIMSLV